MGELIIARNGGSGGSKIDISSATITLASGTLTYDGSVKTKGVSSVVVGGNTLVEGTDYVVLNNSAANAGSYTLYVVGIGNYGGEKGVSWSIGKAQGSISVNPSSLIIMETGGTNVAAISKVGDGAVSVQSSNSNIATATINGNTITITGAGGGNTTITVTLSAGTNYAGSDTTITVDVISATLSENSPAAIQAVAKAGTGASLWSVGNKTAPISVGAVGNMAATSDVCAFIIGFDHNSEIEGGGIHFQFGKTTGEVDVAFVDSGYNSSKTSGTWFNMNNSRTNSGGWSDSRMRSTIYPAFLSALPSTWQNVITSTTKYTDNTGGGSNTASYVTTTSDKIWLLAEFEVFGTRSYANSSEQNYQVQYDYYKNGNSKVKYRHSATSSTCAWWLRSPDSSSSDRFCGVVTSGSGSNGYANRSFGFAPGFRIA